MKFYEYAWNIIEIGRKVQQIWAEFYLRPQVKYAFHRFSQSSYPPTTYVQFFLYRISPKSLNKYENYGYKSIQALT
jgi:hypothetical protein